MESFELCTPGAKAPALVHDEVKLGRMNLVLSAPLAEALGPPGVRIAFLYSRETQELALRPAEPEEFGCHMNRISHSVSVVSVRKFFGFKKQGRFKARLEGQTVIVSLKERIIHRPSPQAAPQKRKKRKKQR